MKHLLPYGIKRPSSPLKWHSEKIKPGLCFKQNDQRQEYNIVSFLIYFIRYWITFDMQESHVWLTWGNNSIKFGLILIFFFFFLRILGNTGLEPFHQMGDWANNSFRGNLLEKNFQLAAGPSAVSFALCAPHPPPPQPSFQYAVWSLHWCGCSKIHQQVLIELSFPFDHRPTASSVKKWKQGGCACAAAVTLLGLACNNLPVRHDCADLSQSERVNLRQSELCYIYCSVHAHVYMYYFPSSSHVMYLHEQDKEVLIAECGLNVCVMFVCGS